MGTIKGNVKEAAGYIKEETGEKLNNKKMAEKGRDLRNEGRVEKGEAPKITPVGKENDFRKKLTVHP